MCRVRLITIFLAAVSVSPEILAVEAVRPFLERYCVDCHDGRNPEAGVRLTMNDLSGEFASHRKIWAEVLEQLETEEMPPEEPFPTGEERAAAIDWVQRQLAAIDFEALRKIEPVPLRRLTKREYRNNVRDFFGMDLQAGTLLPEDVEGESGFRNDATALTTSGPTMEQFFEAAERAVAGWLGPDTPVSRAFEAEELTRSTAEVKQFRDGVVLVHPDHEIEASLTFPVDGTYRFRIRAAAFENRCEVVIRIGNELVAQSAVPIGPWKSVDEMEIEAFVRAGTHTLRIQSANLVLQSPLPPNAVDLVARRAEKNAPRLSGEDDETIALNRREVAIQEAWEWLRLLGPDGDPREIDRFRRYARERDDATEPQRLALSEKHGLTRDAFNREWLDQNRDTLKDRARLAEAIAEVEWNDWMDHQGRLFIDRFAAEGPIFPESRVEPRGKTTIAVLWPRESRAVFEQLYDSTPGDERAKLRTAAVAMLISPDFLYRSADESPEERLSYFLWRSRSQDELPTIEAMLENPRAEAFYESFAEDWLGIANLGTSIVPDRAKFPEFSDAMAASMKSDAVEAVQHLFRADGRLTELSEFAELPAVLTVTSSPRRTNPVRRGAWVLERLLGDPPGEALPNAGELPGNAGEAGLSLAEELRRHREDPTCARCHEKIDPLGFALESFDPLGRLREPSIESELGGPEGLRTHLDSRREEVVQNFTRQLLAFAIGRALTVHDEAAVREIAAAVAAAGYESRELIRQIAQSDLFLKS